MYTVYPYYIETELLYPRPRVSLSAMAAQTETVVVTESVTSQEEQETPRAESSEEGERREAGEKASVSGSVEHEGGDKGFLKGLRRRRNGPKSRRPPSTLPSVP